MNPARLASPARAMNHARSLHAPRRVSAVVLLSVAAATAAALVGPTSAAQAHVQVIPDTTQVGADATLTFRVPSESATASTVKIVITLPDSPPLLSVSAQVVSGWSSTVTQATLPRPVVESGTTLTQAPHTVVWIAQPGHGIPPEQFATFGLLVENLPNAKQLTFPTAQYYSDGSVVTWNQPTVAGKPEPDHPVPEFTLTSGVSSQATSPLTTTNSDTIARWLAAGALVLAALALAAALTGSVRRTPHDREAVSS
jgi:periplasmic copper chaperone A